MVWPAQAIAVTFLFPDQDARGATTACAAADQSEHNANSNFNGVYRVHSHADSILTTGVNTARVGQPYPPHRMLVTLDSRTRTFDANRAF